MADIFDEVEEDLRADRARQFFKTYGILLLAAALAVVAGVGGWQLWRQRQAVAADDVAATYITAIQESRTPAGAAPATAALDRLAATGPEGYRSLARLQAAALKASNGDLPGALLLWDQLSADTQADKLLRDLASLLWVQHQIDGGDPAALEGRLAPLLAAGNAWRPMAQEMQAWLALRAGDKEKAAGLLRQLVADAAAPEGVRERATGLLSRLGEQPAAPAPGTGG